MRGFLFVAREGEGHGQRADTTAVHIDDEDEFGHPVPVCTFAGGETARSESGGRFKQCVKQLHLWLYHGEQKTGNENECRRQHHDGRRFLHQ